MAVTASHRGQYAWDPCWAAGGTRICENFNTLVRDTCLFAIFISTYVICIVVPLVCAERFCTNHHSSQATQHSRTLKNFKLNFYSHTSMAVVSSFGIQQHLIRVFNKQVTIYPLKALGFDRGTTSNNADRI